MWIKARMFKDGLKSEFNVNLNQVVWYSFKDKTIYTVDGNLWQVEAEEWEKVLEAR